MSVAQWQFSHVKKYPAEIGVVSDHDAWTNIELHEQSCRFASALREFGVVPGDRVAVALNNGADLFVVCAGVTIAGAALVVLGDGLSSELIAKVKHCDPKVVVCEKNTATGLAAEVRSPLIIASGAASCRDFQGLKDVLASTDMIDTFVKVSDSDLAQLCYTSGSTGRPKAVPYTYGGLNRFLHAYAKGLPESRSCTSVLVCAPPVAFAGRLITLRVLGNNRYVVLRKFDAAEALAAVESHRISQVSLLPTMAEQLLAVAGERRTDCSSLRSINIGGAHVSTSMIEGLKRLGASNLDRSTSVRVAVQYGMTEAGGGIAMTLEGGDGLVGVPGPGVVVYVSGPGGQEMVSGEIGEIVVQTPFSPDRYWRDPEQSKSVFRNGFVHTGDLGYLRADGQLCLVGRSKDVIVQGGVKIYPAELMNVASYVAGVRECAVIGCPNQLLGEEVVLCIVREDGQNPPEAELRAHLLAKLDSTRQPVHICFVSEIPKTEGGKMDARALRNVALTQIRRPPSIAMALHPITFALAKDVVERTLLDLLAEGCGDKSTRRSLGQQIPFGELGVTSLVAVRLAYRLSESLFIEVPSTLAYSPPYD